MRISDWSSDVCSSDLIVSLGADAYAMQVFSGQLIVAAARTLFHPRRLRLTPTVAMMQDAGVNALPIVFIMTFFIGAIIALVGTNLLTSLGVEEIGRASCRERVCQYV